MIAHKRFKIIGAVVLAVVLTVSMAVPCFASAPTDGSGNFLPSSFFAQWSIYNVDSQSYESIDVTSSVSKDGLTFTLPYNTYGIQNVYLVLYSSSFNLESLYISGSYKYDSDITQTIYYPSGSTLCRFMYNSTSSEYTFGSSRSNPFDFIYSGSDSFPSVSRFRFTFTFNPTLIDGTLSINFSRFLINNEDISSLITVQNLDNASQDLTDLGEQLEVPKPTIQVANIVEDALEGADYQSVGSTTWSFMSNDLITKMLLITVSFALLGYILFGKKESGSK